MRWQTDASAFAERQSESSRHPTNHVPKRYGVIDIRVWRLIYAMGPVYSKQSGTNFRFKNWHRYL
jgi:hypothetical protein